MTLGATLSKSLSSLAASGHVELMRLLYCRTGKTSVVDELLAFDAGGRGRRVLYPPRPPGSTSAPQRTWRVRDLHRDVQLIVNTEYLVCDEQNRGSARSFSQ
jgi:hypothetical protein